MADQIAVFHSFVSNVPDDPTLPLAVRPQAQWNAGHIITGGNNGQVLIRDSTQPFGFNFANVADITSGRLVSFANGQQSVTGSASPTVAMVNLTFTVTQNGSTRLLFTQAIASDTNPTFHPLGLGTVLDGTLLNQFNVGSDTAPTFFLTPPAPRLTALAPGGHLINGAFTSGNAPITATLYFFFFEFI